MRYLLISLLFLVGCSTTSRAYSTNFSKLNSCRFAQWYLNEHWWAIISFKKRVEVNMDDGSRFIVDKNTDCSKFGKR